MARSPRGGRLDPESRAGSLRRGRRSAVPEEQTAGGGASSLLRPWFPPPAPPNPTSVHASPRRRPQGAISKEVRDADVHPTP